MIRTLAALAALLLAGACAFAQERTLYLYIWPEYMPDSVLEKFREETGIRVVATTYDSNEAMYAKLRLLDAGNNYDLALPSTYYVSKMRREGLLRELDPARIPGIARLDPKLRNQPFDPGNKYSVPYLWGSTGIAVDTAQVDFPVTSWADLWRPELKDRVMLMNDVRDVFQMSLRTLGHSANETDPAKIEQAYLKLKELMPNVRTFNSDAPRMPYLEGETAAGMIWNGEAYWGAKELPTLKFVYPKEGVVLWMDSLVMPKNAKNVEEAYAFVEFVLRPEIAKEASEAMGYATPNLEAQKLLDPAIRADRTCYPTEEDLKNGEFQTDIGDAALVYEKYWEMLKAGR